MSILNTNGYSIAKLKTWKSDEGGGYQGDLLKDGKKVGFIHDDGNGGMVMIRFDEERTMQRETTWHNGEKHVVKCGPNELAFYQHVKTLPPIEFMGSPMEYNDEMFVAHLVERLEFEKKIKRWTKVGVVALKGNSVVTWKCAATPANLAELAKRNPTAIFLNDKPLVEAVQLVMQSAEN